MLYVNIASKGLFLLESGINIILTLKKKEDLDTTEKVNLAAEVAFCLLQTGSLTVISGRRIAPASFCTIQGDKIHLTLAASTGVADVARNITRVVCNGSADHFDVLNIIGVIAFRIGDTACCCNETSLAQNSLRTVKALEIGGGATASGISIYRTGSVLYAYARTYFKRRKLPPQELAIYAAKGQNEAEVLDEMHKKVLSIINWRQLKEIPEDLHDEDLLGLYKCGINKTPIRFAVSPRHIMNSRRVYYESATLSKWLRETPDTPPPSWPSQLAFVANNIIQDNVVQSHIDRALETLSSQYKQQLLAENNPV